MDFDLNETQQMLQRSARDFLAKEVPYTRIRQLEDSADGHDPSLWKQMAELGWLALPFPSQYGGADGELLDLAVLIDEMARAAAATPFIATMVAGLAVLRHGSDAQKRDVLPRIASGDLIATTAIVEPEGGYDAGNVKMEAKEDGGGFVLSGTKLFVEYGHVAGLLLTAARTKSGPALLLVPGDANGVTHSQLPVVGTDRQSETVFANVRAAADAVLGKDGAALRDTVDLGAALLSVHLAALGQRALDMTIEYTGMRVQFGRPIGAFQAVQHHIADMAIQADAARLAAYEVIWKLQNGAAEAGDIAYAKAISGSAAREITMMAHQLHGGIGFMKEYDLQFYTRLAAGAALRFGATDDHLAVIEKAIGL